MNILDVETAKINLDDVTVIYEVESENESEKIVVIEAKNDRHIQISLPKGKALKDFSVVSV